MTTELKITLAATHCPWVPARVQTMARFRSGLGILPAHLPRSVIADLTLERSFCSFGGERLPVIEGEEQRGPSRIPPRPALPGGMIAYREERERATNDVWSEKIWQWSVMQGDEVAWCAFGQEDVIPMPGFWPALVAMLGALPPEVEIVGLQANHPLIRQLALEGHRWATTADGLVGPFWIIRRGSLVEFLTWRENELKDGWRVPTPQKLPQLTEDTMVGVWALVTGRKIYHPIPTIIDHDTSIPSTGGNDDHQHRRPAVTWENQTWRHSEIFKIDERPFWSDGRTPNDPIDPCTVPHLGRFYEATPALAYRWVKGVTAADFVKMRTNDGRAEKRRMADEAQAAARSWMRPGVKSPRAKILILTPLREERTHSGYTSTLMRMMRAEAVDLIELEDAWRWQDDLVRIRSRMFRKFLETPATHAWILDGDVEAPASTVLGMLATGRPFVGTPYPRRGRIDFDRARRTPPGTNPEAFAYLYSVVGLPEDGEGSPIQPDGCLHVKRMPLGCSLITRACVESMVEHFSKPQTPPEFWEEVASTWHKNEGKEPIADLLRRAYALGQGEPDLRFDDREEGSVAPTVGLFEMLKEETPEGRELLSEDFSFCARLRAMKIPVAMYMGPGSPAIHYGHHAYQGHLEAFGLQRLNPEEG